MRLEYIGKGGDGDVWCFNGRLKKFSIKKIFFHDPRWQEWVLLELDKKKKYWRELRGARFPAPKVFVRDGEIYFIARWVEGISGSDWVESDQDMTGCGTVLAAILKSARTRLDDLEKLGFCHGDIHLNNLIIGADGVSAEWIDWMHVCKEGERAWRFTPGFASPEREKFGVVDRDSEFFSWTRVCEGMLGFYCLKKISFKASCQ